MPDPEGAVDTGAATDSLPEYAAPENDSNNQLFSDGRETSVEDQYDFGPPEGYNADGTAIPTAGAEGTQVPPAHAGESGGQAAPGTQQQPAPAPAPQFSPQQLARASALGMSPAAVVALGPQGIEAALVQGEMIAHGMALQQQQRINEQQRQAQLQQQQQIPEPKAPDPFDGAGMKKKLMDEGFDEAYANRVVDQEQRLHALAVKNHEQEKWMLKASQYLAQTHQQTQQQAQQVAMQQVNNDFDAFINGLDPESKKLASDPANRAQILATADILVRGMTQAGQKLPEKLGEVFESAKNVVLGKQLFGMARESVRRQVQTHQERAISRPSGSEAPSRGGNREENAAQFADDFYARLGMGTSGPIHSAGPL